MGNRIIVLSIKHSHRHLSTLMEIQTHSAPHLSSFSDHDIVIVTISNAQDISSYTVASTGQCELLYCLIQFVPGDIKRSQKQGSRA